MNPFRKPLQAVIGRLYSRFPDLARSWGRTYNALEFEHTPFVRPQKPLRDSRIALITTGGVHCIDQPPFIMSDSQGDPSFRRIPADTPREQLTITHDYYDHRDADADLNILYPLALLRELRDAGHIGAVAAGYGFMGHIEPPHVETLLHESAPQVAGMLKQEQVDAVLLTPA